MPDTSIHVSEAARRRLDLFKQDDESYNDVIMRLTSRNKWAGFGIASNDPVHAREGLAAIRNDMRETMSRPNSC